VAHRCARWLALDREVKLAAAAGGVAGGHWVGSETVDSVHVMERAALTITLRNVPSSSPCLCLENRKRIMLMNFLGGLVANKTANGRLNDR
jgi:hypothetical protein